MATPFIPLRIKGQTTCIHHKGRQLEFYCEKCQELVCPKCLSSIHKSHTVCELSEITYKKVSDIKNFIDRAEKNDIVQIGKYINSTDTLLEDNTITFEKLSQQLKMQTDKLKEELDMLTAQTLSVYQKMEEDNTKLIQKYKLDLEIYKKQLKQQIHECKDALQRGSHIQIYDAHSEIHFPTYSLHVKPVLGTASFTPNQNPQVHLKEALGKFTTSSGQGQTLTDQNPSVTTSYDLRQHSSQQQSGVKVKKAAKTNILLPQTKVVEEWRSPCYIQSICPTTDGQVWTRAGTILTLLDRKGKVIQTVNHYVWINGISQSPTTHTLWVCDYKNNILELVSGRLTNRFSTKEEPSCICVTASNNVIVGMSKHISKFTTDGKRVCTTMAKGTGKPLVYTPHRISECPVTHNVAVADFSDERFDGVDGKGRIVVMDTDFKELFVYRSDITSTYKPTPQTGGEPFNPWGVVYDSVGNLIIGDLYNNRVLLISGGGQFLRVIHTGTDCTLAVGIDREDVLWVVFRKWGDKVKQLQYSSV